MEIENKVELLGAPKTVSAPVYAWVILAVTMLAGVSAPLNQFKVPPVMPVLMERFQLDLNAAGMLMSIFAITGLFLALPAGMISHKLGPKITGLIATGCMLAGSVLGGLANDTGLLLFSRLVEGVGMGLIAVVAPVLISLWFPPERRGLPMGIWATWVSLGSLIIYNLAPALNTAYGWQSVWWASALITLAAFVAFGLLVRLPVGEGGAPAEAPDSIMVNLKKVLGNRHIWLLALSFTCFNLVVIGVIATYYPTFLKTVRGYDLAGASFVTSIKMVVVVIASPLVGWFIDRIGSPKRIMLYSFLGLALYIAFPFTATGWWIPVLMGLLGILVGCIPSTTFAAVPAMVGKGSIAGLGMGVVMIGQSLGQLLGPLVFSRLVEGIGWANAGYWMMAVMLLGTAVVKFTKIDG